MKFLLSAGRTYNAKQIPYIFPWSLIRIDQNNKPQIGSDLSNKQINQKKQEKMNQDSRQDASHSHLESSSNSINIQLNQSEFELQNPKASIYKQNKSFSSEAIEKSQDSNHQYQNQSQEAILPKLKNISNQQYQDQSLFAITNPKDVNEQVLTESIKKSFTLIAASQHFRTQSKPVELQNLTELSQQQYQSQNATLESILSNFSFIHQNAHMNAAWDKITILKDRCIERKKQIIRLNEILQSHGIQYQMNLNLSFSADEYSLQNSLDQKKAQQATLYKKKYEQYKQKCKRYQQKLQKLKQMAK